METIWQIISESIILILFRYPGAFIRWTFTGFRRPFKDVLNDDTYINGMLGVIAVSGIVVLILKFIGIPVG